MKTIVLIVFLFSVFSCAILERNISFYCFNTKEWTVKEYNHYNTNNHYCYGLSKDTVIMYIYKKRDACNLLAMGPPLLPIIPACVNKHDARLDIDLYMLINGGYNVELDSIKFKVNNSVIAPIKIGEIINDSVYCRSTFRMTYDSVYDFRRYINDPSNNSFESNLRTIVLNKSIHAEGYKYYRFYFDILITKVKNLEVSIGGVRKDGIALPIKPIYIRGIPRLKYWPIYIN